MRALLASTCLGSLAFGLSSASAFAAPLTISDKQTTPVKSSTAVDGGAGDIKITDKGSVVPKSGAAVMLDTRNSVINEGVVQVSDADDAVGILATSTGGTITNSGAIKIDEDYTPVDADKDGDIDGSFAKGTNRYGIHVQGAFAGDVTNSGTITVEGNKSAGISLDGNLSGKLSQSGSISVVGDDSIGVRANDVSGDVRIAGSVIAQGARSKAVSLDGDIGGALTIQGTITSTGYRSVSPPSDPSKLDDDDLLQGGAAVSIAGNVTGGIIFAVPPENSDPDSSDDDKDGIPDKEEGAASVTSYGAAPAVVIGASDRDISIGSVAGDKDKNGIVVDGAIAGNGIYAGVEGNGVVVGGQGGAVSVANGLAVHGSISAGANDANATALRIGAGATVPTIFNTGKINASGGGKSGEQNVAIAIDEGAQVTSIVNSGLIGAASAGGDAVSTAILDRSGKLTSVVNSGSISATGGGGDHNVAIDLSASKLNLTIRQTAADKGKAAPVINGDIRLGSGDDTVDLAAGEINGKISFGGGSDSFKVSGGATFTGSIADSENVALSISGGTMKLAGTGTTALRTLDVSNAGAIGVNVDAETGAATLYKVSGTATFGADSRIALHLSDVKHSLGSYTVIEAGSLTGGDNLSLNGASLPYMYKGSVLADDAGGTVKIEINRKSVGELGLNRSESRAWDSVYNAIGEDKALGDSFLVLSDQNDFKHSLRTMLPDHAGGAFESVSLASRATARMLADPDAPIAEFGDMGMWLQQVAWGRTKSIGKTSGYRVNGWGVNWGFEYPLGDFGRLGGSFSYLAGKDDDEGTSNGVTSGQYEFAVNWRADWNGLHAFARGSAALVDFKSDRRFRGLDDADLVVRKADGTWQGRLYSGTAGLSYRATFGAFSIRPQASVDYYRLHEGHYSERGDEGFVLRVSSRKSDALAASGAIAFGYALLDEVEDGGSFVRFELEGGRRQIAGGKMGSTTARFSSGESFDLIADDETSGWTGAFRIKGGTSIFSIGSEFNAEQQQGHVALSLRAGIQLSL